MPDNLYSRLSQQFTPKTNFLSNFTPINTNAVATFEKYSTPNMLQSSQPQNAGTPNKSLLTSPNTNTNSNGNSNADSSYSAPTGDFSKLGVTGFPLMIGRESNGDSNTLFGNAQNSVFKGYNPSERTIGELGQWASPNGAYGQWVKSRIGRVATPIGVAQIVGTNLRDQELLKLAGLTTDDKFNLENQNKLANALAWRVSQGKSEPDAIRAIRSTWEGFKNVPDADIANWYHGLRGMYGQR